MERRETVKQVNKDKDSATSLINVRQDNASTSDSNNYVKLASVTSASQQNRMANTNQSFISSNVFDTSPTNENTGQKPLVVNHQILDCNSVASFSYESASSSSSRQSRARHVREYESSYPSLSLYRSSLSPSPFRKTHYLDDSDEEIFREEILEITELDHYPTLMERWGPDTKTKTWHENDLKIEEVVEFQEVEPTVTEDIIYELTYVGEDLKSCRPLSRSRSESRNFRKIRTKRTKRKRQADDGSSSMTDLDYETASTMSSRDTSSSRSLLDYDQSYPSEESKTSRQSLLFTSSNPDSLNAQYDNTSLSIYRPNGSTTGQNENSNVISDKWAKESNVSCKQTSIPVCSVINQWFSSDDDTSDQIAHEAFNEIPGILYRVESPTINSYYDTVSDEDDDDTLCESGSIKPMNNENDELTRNKLNQCPNELTFESMTDQPVNNDASCILRGQSIDKSSTLFDGKLIEKKFESPYNQSGFNIDNNQKQLLSIDIYTIYLNTFPCDKEWNFQGRYIKSTPDQYQSSNASQDIFLQSAELTEISADMTDIDDIISGIGTSDKTSLVMKENKKSIEEESNYEQDLEESQRNTPMLSLTSLAAKQNVANTTASSAMITHAEQKYDEVQEETATSASQKSLPSNSNTTNENRPSFKKKLPNLASEAKINRVTIVSNSLGQILEITKQENDEDNEESQKVPFHKHACSLDTDKQMPSMDIITKKHLNESDDNSQPVRICSSYSVLPFLSITQLNNDCELQKRSKSSDAVFSLFSNDANHIIPFSSMNQKDAFVYSQPTTSLAQFEENAESHQITVRKQLQFNLATTSTEKPKTDDPELLPSGLSSFATPLSSSQVDFDIGFCSQLYIDHNPIKLLQQEKLACMGEDVEQSSKVANFTYNISICFAALVTHFLWVPTNESSLILQITQNRRPSMKAFESSFEIKIESLNEPDVHQDENQQEIACIDKTKGQNEEHIIPMQTEKIIEVNQEIDCEKTSDSNVSIKQEDVTLSSVTTSPSKWLSDQAQHQLESVEEVESVISESSCVVDVVPLKRSTVGIDFEEPMIQIETNDYKKILKENQTAECVETDTRTPETGINISSSSEESLSTSAAIEVEYFSEIDETSDEHSTSSSELVNTGTDKIDYVSLQELQKSIVSDDNSTEQTTTTNENGEATRTTDRYWSDEQNEIFENQLDDIYENANSVFESDQVRTDLSTEIENKASINVNEGPSLFVSARDQFTSAAVSVIQPFASVLTTVNPTVEHQREGVPSNESIGDDCHENDKCEQQVQSVNEKEDDVNSTTRESIFNMDNNELVDLKPSNNQIETSIERDLQCSIPDFHSIPPNQHENTKQDYGQSISISIAGKANDNVLMRGSHCWLHDGKNTIERQSLTLIDKTDHDEPIVYDFTSTMQSLVIRPVDSDEDEEDEEEISRKSPIKKTISIDEQTVPELFYTTCSCATNHSLSFSAQFRINTQAPSDSSDTDEFDA
ncbi:unnamed protein product [Rotaria socialis]|uniref:Uncharacterized protein n=2 Tax=Rotaria socialis TaxID=392032 RepID=A0A820XPZ1_9BILA|nr:unnamed protein product [Rotaria socialis]